MPLDQDKQLVTDDIDLKILATKKAHRDYYIDSFLKISLTLGLFLLGMSGLILFIYQMYTNDSVKNRVIDTILYNLGTIIVLILAILGYKKFFKE